VFAQAPDVPLQALGGAKYAQRRYMAGISGVARLPARLPAASADNLEAIAMLVLSGRFVGYLPDHAAAAWVAQDRIRPIRPAELGHTSRFEVAWLRRSPHPAPLAGFLVDSRATHGAKRAA